MIFLDADSHFFLTQEIAYEKSQKYKEGKFIIERFLIFQHLTLGPPSQT